MLVYCHGQSISANVIAFPIGMPCMLQAGLVIFHFYRDIAPSLAKTHGMTYQPALEEMTAKQLNQLRFITAPIARSA